MAIEIFLIASYIVSELDQIIMFLFIAPRAPLL